MLDFLKLCNECEKLSNLERRTLMADKSVTVIAKLREADLPGIDPVETLASFVIGSVVADGVVDEKEYLLMFPALLTVFGSDLDYEKIKAAYSADRQTRKIIKRETTDLLAVLSCFDETIKEDVVLLCLCIVSRDGKVTPKERRYIKALCKA